MEERELERNTDDESDQRYTAWIVAEAKRQRRQRWINRMESALVVLVAFVICALILIVLGWIR